MISLQNNLFIKYKKFYKCGAGIEKSNFFNINPKKVGYKNLSPSQLYVGIFGTFDVDNYGDLLFPLIAKLQLERRIQNINVLPFSPNSVSRKTPWSVDVISTDSIKIFLPSLSAVLIGGGQIVRFDKGYPIPVNSNCNPTIDYWLSPAVMGALLGKPVIWNAVGAWTGSPIPPCYYDVLKAAISASALVAVRNQASREHLLQVNPLAEIQIVPDTAFSLARLLPDTKLSREYVVWCEKLKIEDPYVVIQADKSIANHRDAIDKLLGNLQIKTVVILPICRCHGDKSEDFPPLTCSNLARSDWLSPILTCEVISHASLVIASSLHACITSVCYGVPCVRIDSFSSLDRKFEILDDFKNICQLEEIDRIRNLFLRGKNIDPRAIEYAESLEQYWDEVAKIVTRWGDRDRNQAMSIMLPSFVNLMREFELISDSLRHKSDALRAVRAERDALLNSRTWRYTRFLRMIRKFLTH